MMRDSRDSVDVDSSVGETGLNVPGMTNVRRESKILAHSFRFTSNSVMMSRTRPRKDHPFGEDVSATT